MAAKYNIMIEKTQHFIKANTNRNTKAEGRGIITKGIEGTFFISNVLALCRACFVTFSADWGGTYL
jgi:hypothetical protein